MKVARCMLVAAGFATMAYGALLLRDQLSLSLLTWFVAGPPLHDVLLAPAFAVTGALLARLLPQPWRGAVATGAVVTAVLLLLAIAVVGRPGAAAVNPGLNERASLPGLALLLGVTWAALLGGTAWRARARYRHRR